MKKSLIVVAISLFSLLVLAAISLFGYNQYISIKEHNEQVAKIKHDKAVIAKKDKTFKLNESLFKDAAKRTYDSAKDIANTYQSVWHDAIWNNSVTVDGEMYFDFDSAIIAQKQVFTDDGSLDEMDGSYSAMNKYYDLLAKNVTKNTKDQLTKSDELKASVSTLYNLASDTTGKTLNNYTDDVSEATNDVTVDLSY